MAPLKTAALGLAGIGVALGVFTWWALESSGVALVETRALDGATRTTHVWFVEPEGELWIEAGTPSNPWFLDIQREPLVSVRSEDRSGRFLAEIDDRPEAREQLRSLLRSKYGIRDWWIALVFDTAKSVAVRLVPAPDATLDDSSTGGPR